MKKLNPKNRYLIISSSSWKLKSLDGLVNRIKDQRRYLNIHSILLRQSNALSQQNWMFRYRGIRDRKVVHWSEPSVPLLISTREGRNVPQMCVFHPSYLWSTKVTPKRASTVSSKSSNPKKLCSRMLRRRMSLPRRIFPREFSSVTREVLDRASQDVVRRSERSIQSVLGQRTKSCVKWHGKEAKFKIHDLKRIFASTENLVFILTNGILLSRWCLQELQAALENQNNVRKCNAPQLVTSFHPLKHSAEKLRRFSGWKESRVG